MDHKSFKDQPVARVEDALNGRMSGVQVMSSGVPGGSMKIRVRGASSVNKSNDPLYVVDGIVRETGLEGISPEDIQSIQVLKDASSTAIYGARGANGVVMVQTKSGKAGVTQVTFDGSFGFSNAYNIPEVMSTKEYAQALVDHKGVAQSAVQDYLNGTKPGIDWMDQLLQTGITQNYKVALSQGNEKTQTYFSANLMDQKGVIVDTKSRRYAIKANIHNKVFDWLELTADLNLAQTDNSGAGFAQNQSNPIWVGLNYSPTMEMMAASGKYNLDPYNNIQNNPYGILHDSQNDRKRTMVTGHVDLKFNLLKGLTFTTTNGIDYNDYKWYSFTSTKVNAAGNNMGNNDATVTALQSTNNLTYSNKWGDHGLTATGVWEVTSNEVRRMGMSGTGIAHEQLGYWNIADAASKTPNNGYSKWTMLSGVARVMYNYADRYMLTGTFRADGSSRFTNKKWGYFPSAAAAWTISNEKFWEPIKDAVEYLKIRASYGIIGNQDISPYSTLGSLGTTGFTYGTTQSYTGYWANGLATPDLTWEKVHQFDLGVDFGFFGNRLNVSLDYFNKKTKDALLTTSAPGYLGGTSYWVNAGEVSNKGFDSHIKETQSYNKNQGSTMEGKQEIDLTTNKWALSFTEEQPQVEQKFQLQGLKTWEGLNDKTKVTMGTGVYETTFKLSKEEAKAPWSIDLGDVRESARVYINGKYIGCAWAVPYILDCKDALVKGKNTLRIEVTNLPANRIAELDRQGVKWRKMKEINVVDINYKKTTYENWEPVPSGLNSYVKLVRP